MRILVLGDKVPSMRLGDGLRMFGLLRPLKSRHEFDLLCYSRLDDSLEPAAEELFSNIRTLPFPAPNDGRRRGPKFARVLALDGFKASSAAMAEAIADADSSGRYDLLLDVSANML